MPGTNPSGRQSSGSWLRPVVTGLLGAGVLAFTPANLGAQQKPGEGWEVLERCRVVTDAAVDGDSFHVVHKERRYFFRLYFVDAPETDATLKDRIVDQAAYFGIAADDVVPAGRLAAEFTRERLAGREFTVITRWQNALGRSSQARFYAVVLVEGKNLAEELVARGLARIYGLRANWPDGPRSTTFINQLKNVELGAREQKQGVWDEARFTRATGRPADAPSKTPATNTPLDVNAASFEELQKLPGIGPKLAERIMAGRPYKSIEDLDKVSGIGPKTVERLRPLVRVGAAEP